METSLRTPSPAPAGSALRCNGFSAASNRKIEEVLGKEWSFRVAHYEIRESEIIVLGELSGVGICRQQFGRALRIPGKEDESRVGEDLKRAVKDALAGCAEGLERKSHPATRAHRTNGKPNRGRPNERSPAPLTHQQLSAIFSLAKFRGLDQQAVKTLVRERFAREPGELDRLQAAQIISDLVIRHED